MPTARRIGANIRTARDATNLSQRELGDRLGVDGSDISRYERGIVRPNDERLARMADVLGVELAWFYLDHGPDPEDRAVA